MKILTGRREPDGAVVHGFPGSASQSTVDGLPDYQRIDGIATKQMCRMHEVDSFIEIELQFGGKAKASLLDEAGDIIMQGGSLNGKSLDPLGLSPNSINPWKDNFADQFEDFKVSIDRHFEKIHSPKIGKPPLDKVVIDFKYMDQINSTLKQQVLDYIQLKHQPTLYFQFLCQ